MTMQPSEDVFVRIGRWVESCCTDTRLCLPTGHCRALLSQDHTIQDHTIQDHAAHDHMTPHELKILVSDTALQHPARAVVWQCLAQCVHDEAEDGREQRWALIVLWILTPRLSKAARVIARRIRAELDDVRSALLVGALEGLRSARTADPLDVERWVLRAAFDAGWQTGRRDPRATSMEEKEMTKRALPLGRPSGVAHGSERSEGSHAVRVDRLSLAIAQRAHGERLGALAQHLGLMPHVRQVRHHRRRQLHAPRCDAHRPAAGQQCLFDTRRPADGSPSR
ncbi:hypothetical protein ACWC2K_04775 [Streptomyces chattanoogensis]